MADLVWLHEGALRLTHPVFAAGGPDAATIFIAFVIFCVGHEKYSLYISAAIGLIR